MRDIPKKYVITIPDWIVKRWCICCYLIINWRIEDLVERLHVEPSSKFYQVLAKHLMDYVHNDIMPPEELESTILNMGEDFMAGRPVQLRAGDYIAVQKYMRKLK